MDLELRNPVFNRVGGINCEWNHPEHGWIPFSAHPDDTETRGIEIYDCLLAGDFGPVGDITSKTPDQQLAEIAERRWYQQNLPMLWNGYLIPMDGNSPAALQSTYSAALNGFRLDTDVWKCYDTDTGTIVSRVTTNAEIVELARLAYRQVQDCFTREGILIDAVRAGNYLDSMLNEGWP